MANYRASTAVRLFWKAHKWIYKASSGRIGEKLGSTRNLLLTTTGRKTGLPRDIAITYFKIDDKIVIIGSNLGRKHHPAWYLNLKAKADVMVQIGIEKTPMIAREAEGEERTYLWNKVVAMEKAYAQYESFTDRQIPVVVFEQKTKDESE